MKPKSTNTLTDTKPKSIDEAVSKRFFAEKPDIEQTALASEKEMIYLDRDDEFFTEPQNVEIGCRLLSYFHLKKQKLSPSVEKIKEYLKKG